METETADTGNTNDTTTEDSSLETSSNDESSASSDVDYSEMSLEDLLAADFSDDPIMGQEHKGLPHYSEILKHVPENARKLVSNLRADATRKTQYLADARRQLDLERAQLQAERDALYSGDFARKVQETAAQETKDLDLYDEAGLQKRIEIETAKRLQDMLRPMQEQIQAQQHQAKLESFRASHPDMAEPAIKMAIVKELMARDGLKLEDAYHIVKGRLASEENAKLRSEQSARKTSQRQALEKTGTRSSVGPIKAPAGMSAWEAFQWAKANGVK
jgi:hypothetical protein